MAIAAAIGNVRSTLAAEVMVPPFAIAPVRSGGIPYQTPAAGQKALRLHGAAAVRHDCSG